MGYVDTRVGLDWIELAWVGFGWVGSTVPKVQYYFYGKPSSQGTDRCP